MSNQEKSISGLGDYLLAELRAQMKEYSRYSHALASLALPEMPELSETDETDKTVEAEQEEELRLGNNAGQESSGPLNRLRFDSWYGTHGTLGDYPLYPPGFFCE